MVLWPLSKLYGLAVAVRNMLFDRGILKQHSFDIPVVVVGNIAVGGTGKTPHTEYIVEQLSEQYSIAVLSRGYKRRTKGFVAATPDSTPDEIGDEPTQIYRRFAGKVPVVVCEDRVKGIRTIRSRFPEVNMVVLDDAFQHRYVKPSAAVVLVELGKPPYRDSLLPLGRLREPQTGLNRADIVVVTKCPAEAKPMDYREFKENLNLYPYQKLFFSRYRYMPALPIFAERAIAAPTLQSMRPGDILLSLTGIANPLPFVRFLRRSGAKVKILKFDDHHRFTMADMELIKEKFRKFSGRKYIITTEKDAIRLEKLSFFPEELKPFIFYLPIHVEMIQASAPHSSLDEAILQTLRENSNQTQQVNC